MENYQKYNWEYTPQESLEIDKEKLDNANCKLTRKLNPWAREIYEKEKQECEENIKKRTAYILTLK